MSEVLHQATKPFYSINCTFVISITIINQFLKEAIAFPNEHIPFLISSKSELV